MENSTPCKIVTPENFILKLGTLDYVENITHYTNFHVYRFSGGFSTNRWNIAICDFFSVLSFFLAHTPSSNRTTDFRGLWLKWRSSTQGRSFWGLGRWVTSFGGNVPPKKPQKGAWIGIFKPNKQNIKTYISQPRFEGFRRNLARWCSLTL